MSQYVQLPPDSTGKKILHYYSVVLHISSIGIPLTSIEYGDELTGATSNATGTFTGYKIEFFETQVHLHQLEGATQFQVGEQLEFEGAPFATIDSVIPVYIPKVSLTDPVNHSEARIDTRGNIFVRDEEGSQPFDAFGYAQTSQVTLVDEHTFVYSDDTTRYYTQIATSGAVVHDAQQSMLKLTVTDQNGSLVKRTSNIYYPYVPGEGNFAIFSLALGDTGKANNTRRWGIYDDNNGLFFEVADGVFSVNVRSSTSGSPVDRKVVQDDFNQDTLKNTNISQYIIQLDKMNLYWIDYQWLGVGKVRFGVIAPNGTRTVIHTFENANQFSVPYMQSGSLPIRWENFNTGATSGNSELRCVCAALMRQNKEIEYRGRVYTHNSVGGPFTVTDSAWVPVFSARPKTTFGGKPNRKVAMPTAFEVVVIGDPVRLDQFYNPTLTGADWNDNLDPRSAFEIDSNTGVTLSGGSRLNTVYFDTGVTHRIIPEFLPYGLSLSADGVTQPWFSLALKCAKPGGSSTVIFTLRWKEAE